MSRAANSRPHAEFSARQAGVAACLLDGLSDEHSAAALGIEVRAVRYERDHLRRKVGARSIPELALALEWMVHAAYSTPTHAQVAP